MSEQELIESELKQFCASVLNRKLTESESNLLSFKAHTVDNSVYEPVRSALLKTAPCRDAKIKANPILLAAYTKEFNDCLAIL